MPMDGDGIDDWLQWLETDPPEEDRFRTGDFACDDGSGDMLEPAGFLLGYPTSSESAPYVRRVDAVSPEDNLSRPQIDLRRRAREVHPPTIGFYGFTERVGLKGPTGTVHATARMATCPSGSQGGNVGR